MKLENTNYFFRNKTAFASVCIQICRQNFKNHFSLLLTMKIFNTFFNEREVVDAYYIPNEAIYILITMNNNITKSYFLEHFSSEHS